jgi:hypothetical protein
MRAEISLHYDGPIAQDHRLSLRVIGGAFDNLQGAIDRAVLDLKYGSVWKHARLARADYPLAEFDITGFRQGGFIADLRQAASGLGPEVLRRIRQALAPGYEAALRHADEEYESLADQAALRLQTLETGAIQARKFNSFLASSDEEITGRYGDRSILKEFDQILTPIRSRAHAGSTLEIVIADERELRVDFNSAVSKQFHRAISQRQIGRPLLVDALIKSLDQGNQFRSAKGKLENLVTEREFILHIPDEYSFNALVPFLVKGEKQQPVQIVACPVLEYNSFDPYGGDMYFLRLA